MSVVARIWPDWKPENKNLPKTFIAKISSLATAGQVMNDKRYIEKGANFEDASSMLDRMEESLTRVRYIYLYTNFSFIVVKIFVLTVFFMVNKQFLQNFYVKLSLLF